MVGNRPRSSGHMQAVMCDQVPLKAIAYKRKAVDQLCEPNPTLEGLGEGIRGG